jgi:superfamily II DNA/RNA helicase
MTTTSSTSFAHFNLAPPILKAIETCGYTTPTPIQAQAIPHALAGKDVIACAQTGTGKTAAFVLPALHRLSTTKAQGKPRLLILTPTRELANQILQTLNQYAKFLRLMTVCLVGGVPYFKQLKDLSKPVDIIVATPGRLLDVMDRGRVNLSGIELLVLDEADRMLDMGFIDDVKTISKAVSQKRQTLLFSATVDGKLASIAQHLLKDPVKIDVSKEQMTSVLVTQEMYRVNDPQHKLQLLQHFMKDQGVYKAIIFSATKINADKLARQLCAQGYSAAALHGDLKQKVRYRTIEQFTKNKVQYLVATDVAARGINITDVSHVINYDLPKFSEDYVHRIGRTGRAGKRGIAISLVLPSEGRMLQRIERYVGERIKQCVVPGLEPTKSFENAPSAPRKRGKKSYSDNKKFGKPRSSRKPGAPQAKKYYEQDGRAERPYARREQEGRAERPHARREQEGRSERPYARREQEGRAERPYARREQEGRAERPYARREQEGRAERPHARREQEGRAERPYARREQDSRAARPVGREQDSRAGRPHARREQDKRAGRPHASRPSRQRSSTRFGER